MAEQLTLVKRPDLAVADIGTLSLFNYSGGSVGFEIRQGGSPPQTFDPGDETVINTYGLIARGTSTDNLSAVIDDIDQKIIEANNFLTKPAEPYGIWLRDQMNGETNARQSHVISITREIVTPLHDKYPAVNSHQVDVNIAIERMPWFEATTPGTVTLGTIYAMNNYRSGTVVGEAITGFVGGTFLSHGTTDNHPVGTANCVVHYFVGGSGGSWLAATANPSTGTIVGASLTSSYIVFATGAMQMCGGDAGNPWTLDYTYSGNAQQAATIGALGPSSHDLPSRVARTDVMGVEDYGTISEIWAGWRTAGYGATANFLGIWEAEKTAPFGADTAATADATCTNGSALAITFASSTAMVYRARNVVGIFTVNFNDQRGEFDVIARARVTSGTANMRMDAGLFQSTTVNSVQTGEPVSVSAEYWQFYNLGRMTIPAIPQDSQTA